MGDPGLETLCCGSSGERVKTGDLVLTNFYGGTFLSLYSINILMHRFSRCSFGVKLTLFMYV